MDSGALLTTCAGSGATLVAIIGGFLLTRYMTVEAEIRGADRSIAQAKIRLAGLADRREQAQQRLTDHDIDEAFDSTTFIALLVTCFDNNAEVAVEHARAAVPLDRFSDHDVRRRLDAWVAEVEVARSSGAWSRIRPQAEYGSLRDFLRRARVDAGIEPIWRVLYENEKKGKRLEPSSGIGSLASMDAFDLPDPDDESRTAYSERLHQAEVEFRAAQAEMRVTQANRSAIAEPTGLQWEIVVLVLVALLTIAPSLALLAPRPAQLERSESVVVVAFFALGLALLVGYLARWASKARDAWLRGEGSADRDFVIEG